MKNRMIAFASEFGNNSFNFSTQGSHFIVASIIIHPDKLEGVKEKLEVIRRRHFETEHAVTRWIADKTQKRKAIITDLNQLDFSVYAVIINKRRLYSEGFQYKQSFYKYLNGLVYKEIYRTLPNLTLYVDEQPEKEFMRSFKTYVHKNYIPELFSNADFELHSSNQHILIQLADFMADTLGCIYDETRTSADSQELFNLIAGKMNSLNFFPKEYKEAELIENTTDPGFDPVIAELAINRAIHFVDNIRINGQQEIDQVNCVKLLLLYNRAYNHNRFISTQELLNHLNINKTHPLKEQYFRTMIIGRIRDKGVLIASSNDGYKLPSSAMDMKKFINHGKRIILPMLHRIKLCQDAIQIATGSGMNILDTPEFAELDQLLNSIKHSLVLQ